MDLRKVYKTMFTAFVVMTFVGCNGFLDTKIDTNTTPDAAATNRNTLWQFAAAFYSPLTYGFSVLDGNLFAAASDEAVQTSATGDVYYFYRGTINANANPLSNLYKNYYEGIRAANFFLEYAKNGEELLAMNRNLVNEKDDYEKDIRSLNWYRAEAHIAKAFYYAELLKMYGGVPIVEKTMSEDPDRGSLVRASYDAVVDYIVKEIDDHKDGLQIDWQTHPDNVSEEAGRFTLAAALAIKARALLYAASPLHNPNNDKSKWENAAKAAHDVISMLNYRMPENRNYRNSFIGEAPLMDKENIFIIRRPTDNTVEKKNYPISTAGGNSGITPTQNLVSAYEYIGEKDPMNPYKNRDPRLEASIVVNGSRWNDRIIDQSVGSSDDMSIANTSRTGYYLKKFLTDKLNLVQDGKAYHHWIVYRYAEVLLNYAEAMNQAYGPDALPSGYTMTAREALMQVRNSASTSLPAVATADVTEFEKAVKHERRIELAFEDHRYWDLLRWKDAEKVLNLPLKGVTVTKDINGVYGYQEVTVMQRTFLSRNYYFPFTRSEIQNSNGALVQNEGY